MQVAYFASAATWIRLIHLRGPDGVVNKKYVGITIDTDNVEVDRAGLDEHDHEGV